MRYFNTSGPNIPDKHYTIEREDILKRGLELVKDERYFTIWAPRQTGKSTYFRQLAIKLEQLGYKVAHINFENFRNAPIETFLLSFTRHLREKWGVDYSEFNNISHIFEHIQVTNDKKCVLIIDEVEGINKEYFGDFLHSIRNAYHSRESHCLKSVVLVGVSNILGVVQDNASPFNIADNLDVPYFTKGEVFELLHQHEAETGQLFDDMAKDKIFQITAGQPGLVNGFAKVMVDRGLDKKVLGYNDFLKVEDWYLTEAIDKNLANILKIAEQERTFIERLLFTEENTPFKINRPSIKLLHVNGLIKKDNEGNVAFWVPLYKKSLHDAFYPYTNGEQKEIAGDIYAPLFFDDQGKLKISALISEYKKYVKRRSFKVFLEKDENGKYIGIMESALIYSFETYIAAFITQTNGKIYREADTGLGKSDMIIHIEGREYLIETKVYYGYKQFETGKQQLAYYANSLGLNEAIYLVFVKSKKSYPESVREQTETINNTLITSFLVEYDDGKW
ncbi:MAG: hypothetical protein B6D64_04625 [Bacteroidetes bacterium 4484_276]|nr:MAG: hypothetical protein B6D64_04625 [Bacteroidetes bacterium 4484_276]